MLLQKAADYRTKAEAAGIYVHLKLAFKAIAREYMKRARALKPDLPPLRDIGSHALRRAPVGNAADGQHHRLAGALC